MADVNSNIFINIDTTQAMAALRSLDRQISAFNRAMVVGSKAAATAQADFQRSLLHNVNATGQFTASMAKMSTATEQFAHRLDAGKLSLREYYRYGMASTKTFGSTFRNEFNTVSDLVQRRVKTLQSQYVQFGRDAQGALNAMRLTPKMLNTNDQLTRMQMAIQRQQIFNKLMDDGAVKLLNFGKNTQWAGRQLMVGFTIPLAMFAASAIKSFKEIETQAIRFKKVYGDIFTSQAETGQALKQMQEIADKYTKYGLKVAETLKTAADAAAAGNTGDALSQIVEQSNKLAVLGGVAQDKALETVIALQNAFGISSKELGKNIDYLNAVENQTVLSLEDITNAIPRVAPVIKQLGGDVKDLTLFLTAMKEGGVSAEQGANALKSGLASLINPTKSASDAAAALGINLKGIVEANAGNLKNTVMAFAKSLQNLSDLQRGQIIEKVFGKYQFARLSAMFNNITKEGTQANRVMKLAAASAEELAILSQREMKLQENSPMFKMQKQIEQFKATLAPVGAEFAKALTPVIEFFGKVFKAFNNMPDGFKKISTIIIGIIGGIAPVVLMTVGLVANGIANLMKMFNLIRKGYQHLAYGSKEAALGTEYMSQAELENVAVTNTLATEHTNLSAAYKLEANALASLTAIYQEANIAMATFAKNNPGMFMPRVPGMPGMGMPRRYNSGVAYVPGSGNTDTVPALLTPGEAVVSKPMVAKYGGLVEAIVNDRIPGHMFGINSIRPLMFREPTVVGSLGFGEAAALRTTGGSAGVSVRNMLSLADARSSSLSAMSFAKQGDLIEVNLGQGAKFFVKESEFPKFKSVILENEEFQIARGDARESIPDRVRHAISKPSRDALGKVLTASKIRGWLPTGQGERNSVQFKEIADKRWADLIASKNVHAVRLKNYMLGEEAAWLKANLPKDVYERMNARGAFGEGQMSSPSHFREVKSQNRTPEMWSQEKIARDWFFFNNGLRGKLLGGNHPANALQARNMLAILQQEKKLSDNKLAMKYLLDYRLNIRPKLGKKSYYDDFIFGDNAMIKNANRNIPLELNRGGIIPGYMGGISMVPGKGLFLGMPLGLKAVAARREQSLIMQQIEKEVAASRFGMNSPEKYGEQISATTGHSFPVPGIGGTYRKANGDLVFVKPVINEIAALAEQRATTLAREAHGLESPKQTIKTMIDPTDPAGKRRLFVLESPVEEKFAKMTGKFTKDQYFKQLVASLVRGDKDLQMANLSANVLADVGTAGVFAKASGLREYATSMPSMAEQAKINLLGVKGGARRFFAEATLDIPRSMTPQAYHAAMIAEIESVIPRMKKSIDGMNLTKAERALYDNMVARLEEGKNVNWAEYHAIHSSVVPQIGKQKTAAQILKEQEAAALKKRQQGAANQGPMNYFNSGVFSVPGTGNQDTVPAMLTPGEAVIPKGMAEKYRPLVSAIITDNVPGHSDGWDPDPWGTTTTPTRNPSRIDGLRSRISGYAASDSFRNLVTRITPAATALGNGMANAAKVTGRATAATAQGIGAFFRRIDAERAATAATDTRTRAELINARQSARYAFSQKMMPISMAAMMAPMAAGAAAASGNEWAKKNMGMITGLSMFAMVLPMLNSPLKLLIATVIGLIAVFKLQSKAIKTALTEGETQAKAMTMTTDKLEAFGAITNEVSTTQEQDAIRRARVTELKPVNLTFGKNFAGSDTGKSFIQDAKQTMATLGRDAGIQSVVGQLATAVTQGVLTSDQADSIATYLARTMKDQRLELQIRGRLSEILGPNGKNILDNPLEVQLKILGANKELETAALGNLNATTAKVRGIQGNEALQLAGGAIPAAMMARYATNRISDSYRIASATRAEGRMAVQEAKMAQISKNIANLGKMGELAQFEKELSTTKRALTFIKGARAAATVAEGAQAATVAGALPAAVEFAITTVLFAGMEYGIRKWQEGKEKKIIAKAAGLIQGTVVQNLAAGQKSIDALNQEYDLAIQNLELKKKVAKTEEEKAKIEKQILDMQTQKQGALVNIRQVQANQLKSAAGYFDQIETQGAKDKYADAFRVGMENKFKKDPALAAQAAALQAQISGEAQKTQVEIQALVTSDVLTPNEASTMVAALTGGKRNLRTSLEGIVKLQGTEGLQRLSTILTLIPSQVNQRRIIADVQYKNKDQADEVYAGLEELIKIPSFVGINIDVETNGKQDVSAITRLGKEATQLKKLFPSGKIDLKAITKVQQDLGKGTNLTLDRAIEQWKILKDLDPNVQLQAMITLGTLNMSDTISEEQVAGQAQKMFYEQNPEAAKLPKAERYKQKQAFMANEANQAAAKEALVSDYIAKIFPQATKDTSKTGGAGAGAGGGAKKDTSWLVDLMQRLKLVKESAIDALHPLAAIDKFFGKDATKSVNPFLDNQSGALDRISSSAKKAGITMSKDFLSIIENMDAEQFKLYGKDWFTFDAKGRITGITDAFKKLNEVVSQRTVGNYLQKIKDDNKVLTDKVKAYDALTSGAAAFNGQIFASSDAMKLLEDEALAADIANGKVFSKEEIDAFIARLKAAKNGLADVATITQKDKNAATKDQIDAFKKLTKGGVEFQTALRAIGNADWVKKILADTGDVSVNLKDIIAQAKAAIDLEYQLSQLSEGSAEKLNQQFAADAAVVNAKALTQFRAANGKSLEMYKADTADMEFTLSQMQKTVDDYAWGISRIEKSETAINDTYKKKTDLIDEQISALDKVSNINDQIIGQQKQQLGIANAITSGDIAAAAAAAQDYKASQAQFAAESSKTALSDAKTNLDKQRQAQIDALTYNYGGTNYTKKQLEDMSTTLQEGKMRDLEKQIADRNEVVATYERNLARNTAMIQKQGMSVDEWNSIQSAVTAVNDAYGKQVVDINKIADGVNGVSDAWSKLVTGYMSDWSTLKGYEGPKGNAAIEDPTLRLKLAEEELRVQTQLAAVKEAENAAADATFAAQQADLASLRAEAQSLTAQVMALLGGKVPGLAGTPSSTGGKKSSGSSSAGGGSTTTTTTPTTPTQTPPASSANAGAKMTTYDRSIVQRATAAGIETERKRVTAISDTAYEAMKNFNKAGVTDKETAGKKLKGADYDAWLKLYYDYQKKKAAADTFSQVDLGNGKVGTASSSDISIGGIAYREKQFALLPQWVKDAVKLIDARTQNAIDDVAALKEAQQAFYDAKDKYGIGPEWSWADIRASETANKKVGKELNAYEAAVKQVRARNNATDTARANLLKAGYTDANFGWAFADPQSRGNTYTNPLSIYSLNKDYPNIDDLKNIMFYSQGGFVARGTDTIPAMLTPGEFVMNKSVTDKFGPLLNAINSGNYSTFDAPRYKALDNIAANASMGTVSTTISDNSSRVYNYSVGINVNGSNADANDIAREVITQIKYIDSQRLRGQR